MMQRQRLIGPLLGVIVGVGVALRPGKASFAFVAASGRVLDPGSVRCRR